jgi:hypothetical protein
MLWVGGGIILHGLEVFELHFLPDLAHHIAAFVASPLGALGPFVGWLVNAVAAGVFGLAVGSATAAVIARVFPSAVH